MAEKTGTLTDSDIAFVKEQARLLAADLAFYARGPIRLHLIGGDQFAFTVDAGGGGSFIDMYLNPKVLFDIRNRERAVKVWRGMGVHELGHHLFPAKEQYEQAAADGGGILVDMLNLLDDEQNERNCRSMNPEWGECLQTTAAWVFRGKGSAADQYHHGKSRAQGGEIPVGGSTEIYLARRNEFAYHFRRNLPGAKDAIAAEALALIPRNLKDISKAELLELARKVVATLALGIELPKPVAVKAASGTTGDAPAEPGRPAPGKGPSLPFPSIWKSLTRSVWTYVFLAVFVAGWFALFSRGGYEGWDGAFWGLLVAVVAMAGFAGLAIWLEQLRKKRGKATGGPPPGRWETVKDVIESGWRKTKEAVAGAARRVADFLERVTPKPVARAAAFVGGLLLRVFPAVIALVLGAWWLLKQGWRLLKAAWRGLKRGARALWNSTIFRMFLLAAPLALLLVMIVSVILKGNWIMLLILLLILLLLLFLAWLFRKTIKAFAKKIAEEGDRDEADKDGYDDSAEMLEFNVVTNVVPVEANEAVLESLLPDVIPLSQEMRRYLEQCGRVPVEREDQEVGYDLADDLEKVALGETSVYVDDEMQPAASVHIEMLIDCSGSMGGNKILLAQRFGLLIEESVRGVRGITARVWGFTDRAIYDCGQPGEYRVSGLTANGGNNDAGALWHAFQSAQKSGKQLKILLMISDGLPTECTWGSLHNLVCRLEAAGYIPVQIAVGQIDNPAFKRHFVSLVGQPIAAAVIEFGRMLLSLVEE